MRPPRPGRSTRFPPCERAIEALGGTSVERIDATDVDPFHRIGLVGQRVRGPRIGGGLVRRLRPPPRVDSA